MPSNMLYLDTNFPSFTGEESPNEKISTIQNYLYMLVEQMRYSLRNLDLSNMNKAAVEKYETYLTEPIYARIEDGEGKITQLQITAEGLGLRISNAEGNITTLQATAEGLALQISDAEDDILQLGITADALAVQISAADGRISQLQQTVDSFSLSVSNGSRSSRLYLTANGVSIASAQITFTGVVTFQDLSTSGATTINGDNITTGTIYADIIHLGGKMNVYRTTNGFGVGGYIGYMSGMTGSGTETAGIAITSSNEAAVVICTTAGARMGYNGVSTVVCTSNQVSITGNAVYINGEPATTSDARRKTDVKRDVDDYLKVFDRLEAVTFRYIDGTRRHMGLIAQEVQKILQEEEVAETDFAALCTEPKSDEYPEGLHTLRYGEIQIMTIAKVQQLAREIAQLREQVRILSGGKENT